MVAAARTHPRHVREPTPRHRAGWRAAARRRTAAIALTAVVGLAAGFATAAAVQAGRARDHWPAGGPGAAATTARVVGIGPARPAAGLLPAAEPATPGCVPAPLEERAAVVLVVGMRGVTDPGHPLAQEVAALGVGGLFISDSNVLSATQVSRFVALLRAAAPRPLVVATDEESGRVADMRTVLGAGPSPRRMADRLTVAEVRAEAAETGTRLAELGIDLDLAPVLDLDPGPWDGIIGDRSFSADPEVAAEYGLAFAAGLADAGVVPTVKHFPGHGRSTGDSHVRSALVRATLDELRSTDLVPFQRAVDVGVPVVMLNHLQYEALDPDLPASLSPRAYALLRDMGFEGVAITDSLGMGAVNSRWDYPVAAVLAVAAGADAVLAVDGTQAVRMRDALVEAVRSGAVPEERLSEAAARVTALGGGDPRAMSCLDVVLPGLDAAAPLP